MSRSEKWERLYDVLSQQAGLFTARQALEAGFTRPALSQHKDSGKIERLRHSVYRLVHFPVSEHEDFAAIWLWSNREGTFSHESALSLWELSDIMPNKYYVTLPLSWKKRRVKMPPRVVPHYAQLESSVRAQAGPVPVTAPTQTIIDCAQAHVDPDIVNQAISEGVARGLFGRKEINREIRHASQV